jgi:hypothetical protein
MNDSKMTLNSPTESLFNRYHQSDNTSISGVWVYELCCKRCLLQFGVILGRFFEGTNTEERPAKPLPTAKAAQAPLSRYG